MAEQDIVDRLTDDHNDIRALFGQLDTTPAAQRGDLFRHIVSELARHEAAEEAVVHSATRDDVPGGEQIANAVLEEENQAAVGPIAGIFDRARDAVRKVFSSP